MKIIKKLTDNLLFIFVLLLLIFIPLYPKIPLIGVTHTWVYIRAEDFIISAIYIIFGVYLMFKKAKLRAPLTIPIFLFWGVGLFSTVYAILFIFPHLTGVFPKLAFLNWARRIEYLGLFFVGYSAIKDKKQLKYIVWTLVITLFAVVAYGFGQKYLGFPAFLTGNEEFAKGIPLRLSAVARIPSTFAGHYDLAAWLVMIIPLLAAFFFSYKKIFLRILFVISAFFALILLLMTASRVSFMVYLISISFFFVLAKKKKYIIPVILLSLLLMRSFDTISQRFLRTVSTVDLVVDARTGKAVGILDSSDKTGTVINEKQSTGEQLPQGTGFINLPGNTGATQTQITYKRTKLTAGKETTDVTDMEGQFIVKKALAYDVSFTTRFQGTWPRAIQAFERNILTGSGYSSISLATDGNYLRILGEVGILGLLSFALIFIIYSIYVAKNIGKVKYDPIKSFTYGMCAAILGVALNAILIDVFEASKVAYPFWLLIGMTVGFLSLYQKEKINYVKELRKVLTSSWAIVLYLFGLVFGLFSMILNNYFVGDDFTWLHWAANCKKVIGLNGLSDCQPLSQTMLSYFTDANGFFYRPGSKIYFYFMYSFFWLNNLSYHVGSILAHFVVTVLVFLIANKLLKNKLFAFIAALFFLAFSIHYETIFWIASTGHLVAALFALLSLVLYALWTEKKGWYLLPLALISAITGTFFHEYAIVIPFIIIAYDLILNNHKKSFKPLIRGISYILFVAIIPGYLFIREIAHSHWLSGDYNYNFAKLPFNAIGNTIGYLGMILFGPSFQRVVDILRTEAKGNMIFLVVGIVISIAFLIGTVTLFVKNRKNMYTRVILFCCALFIISLLAFLGLGNITSRYTYLPSVAIAILLSLLLMAVVNGINKYSKKFGFLFMVLFVGIYLYLNIHELYEINRDWQRAGSITQSTLTGFNDYFQVKRVTPKNPVFYFVNVPIKTGDAWIFPVGLDDALWFTFQNEYLTVKISKSLNEALDQSEGSLSARVFEFNKDGSVEEVARTKTPVVNGK